MERLKRRKEKWQLPVGLGYQRAATHQALLIVTKRGNGHHYTGYQQRDQYCRGQKKESQLVWKRDSETLCMKLCWTSPVDAFGSRGRGFRKQANKIKNKERKCMIKLIQSTELIRWALRDRECTNSSSMSVTVWIKVFHYVFLLFG